MRAAAEGARVALGTCVEGLCPPFAPLREIFSGLDLPSPFENGDEPSPSGGSRGTAISRFSCRRRSACLDGGPNLVLLDDLHWADFATLEFLAFFARKQNAAVLAIGTVRSDDLERDHAQLDAVNRLVRNGARRVDVDPLGRDDMHRLVSFLWPVESPQPSDQVERVCALAEGKPYFAEELVSSALALSATPAFDALPLSIRAGILARFERISGDERDILLQASVIGQTFVPALLAQLAKRDEGCVLAALAAARELLYRELLQAQRQTTHRELAAILERADRPADAGQVAFHWKAAGERARSSRPVARGARRGRRRAL
ncbi:MAG: hypothetical protein WAK80_05995 [Candidatus Cybelea sp.]